MSKKASSYSEAKSRLDENLAETGNILSVRQLKSKCGGVGSLDTFQKYLNKWKAESTRGTSLVSTIMALGFQLDANSRVCDELIKQLLRIATTMDVSNVDAADGPDIVPYEGDDDIEALETKSAPLEKEAAGKEEAVEGPVDLFGGSVRPSSTASDGDDQFKPLAGTSASELSSENKTDFSQSLQTDHRVKALARDFAKNSVARFIPDETPATDLSDDASDEIDLELPCSRAPAGSQHAAQQEGADQPDEGEHDKLEISGQISTGHERGEPRETGRLNDTDLASPSLFGEHAREFGSSTQARPIEDGTRACDPRAENSDEQDQENSCSRDVPGSQHAAPRDDANQPDKGEHDTNSGSRHDAV